MNDNKARPARRREEPSARATLKGGAAFVLILALLAAGFWAWMNARSKAAVAARLAELQRAGEPVTAEHFIPPTVPNERNAALLLLEAARKMVSPPNGVYIEDLSSLPRVRRFPRLVRTYLEGNAEALRLVHEAARRPHVDWRLRVTSPVIMTLLPHLSPQRDLAKLLRLQVVWRHAEGDDAGALDAISDGLFIGRALEAPPVFLINQLTTFAVEWLMCTGIEEIAPALRIDAPGSHVSDGASREAVAALIEQLLDETSVRDGWRDAMRGERFSLIDSVEQAISGGAPWVGGPASYLMRAAGPIFRSDLISMIDMTTAALEAGAAPTYPEAADLLPVYPQYNGAFERAAHFMSAALLPSGERPLELMFKLLAERRLAACALAIRVFELDHGRKPATLQELVPEYLPRVPADPMDRDQRPLIYRPDLDPPRLYSIGSDGVDDGGAFTLEARGVESPDVIFFLDGRHFGEDYWNEADDSGLANAIKAEGAEVEQQRQPDDDQQGRPDSQPGPDQPDQEL